MPALCVRNARGQHRPRITRSVRAFQRLDQLMCQGHATTVDAEQASSCGSDLINQQFLRLSRPPASLPLIGGELGKQCSSVPLSLFSGLTRLPPWWPDSRLPGLTWSEKEENRLRGDGQSSPDMTSVVFGFTPHPTPAPSFRTPLHFAPAIQQANSS